MDSLVNWKKKRDNHHEEFDDDDTDIFSPRLNDTMNEVLFIRRDSANAEAMRKMKMRWWK